MTHKAKKTGVTTAQPSGQTVAKTTAAQPQQTKNNKTEAKAEVKFTDVDKVLFQQQESLITSKESAFLEIGQALSVIKSKDLQKITDPNLSFNDYCNRRWGYGDKYAYKLINAYDCVAKLKAALVPKGVTVFPTCEAQVRPLTKVDPAKQIEIWAALVENADGMNITAAAVEETVSGLTGTGSKAASNETTASVDEETATTKAKADHRKIVAIGKLVAKIQEIEPAKLSVEKLKAVVDKIAEVLKEDEG